MHNDASSRGGTAVSCHPSNRTPVSVERSVPYQPQFCERNIGRGAGARTATIVYQQLRYWSFKGQHQFEEDGVVKVWFYKKAEELAEELQMSVPTIRRALKRLVSLGLLVVRQWWKHRYFRTNFFHLPQEPETIQRDARATATAKNKQKTSTQAHRPPAGRSTIAEPPVSPNSPASPSGGDSVRGRSVKAKRTHRSDQNGGYIQKKTSIEEITYMLSQKNLWRDRTMKNKETCHMCGGAGTIEAMDGNILKIHKCSCSAGARYNHLPSINT